jgi:hypothetical protein
MAKPKNDAANGDAAPANGEATAPNRFRSVATESYMFNAEKCYNELSAKEKLPLVGYLLGMKEMPPIKGREWQALVIQTTEPVHAIDREKNVILVEPGNTVLVPATFMLEQALAKAALNPTSVFEVSIAPKKKIEIGGGQTMWTYEVGANPKALNRKNFGVAALLDAPGAVPALPAAGESGADETPF